MIGTLRWVISIILIGSSLYAILGNLWIALAWYLFKKRASLIPFVGGVLGAISLLVLPVSGVRHFFWIPLVADLGCGPMLIAVTIDQAIRRFATKPKR